MELRSLYRGVLVILSSLQYTVWRLTCMSWWTNNRTKASKVLGIKSECSKCCEYVNMWMCQCVNVVNIINFFEYCKNNSKILDFKDLIGYHFGNLYRQTSTSNPPLFVVKTKNHRAQGEVIHWPLFKAFLVTLTYLTFRKLQNTMKIFVKAKAKLVFLIMLMTYFAVLLYQARTETLSPIPSQSQVWISLGEQLYWIEIRYKLMMKEKNKACLFGITI